MDVMYGVQVGVGDQLYDFEGCISLFLSMSWNDYHIEVTFIYVQQNLFKCMCVFILNFRYHISFIVMAMVIDAFTCVELWNYIDWYKIYLV